MTSIANYNYDDGFQNDINFRYIPSPQEEGFSLGWWGQLGTETFVRVLFDA